MHNYYGAPTTLQKSKISQLFKCLVLGLSLKATSVNFLKDQITNTLAQATLGFNIDNYIVFSKNKKKSKICAHVNQFNTKCK